MTRKIVAVEPLRVLVVAAHPDDEVLGCGGTTLRLLDEGANVETLIIGEGRGSEYDNQFDKRPLIYYVELILQRVLEFNPDSVFTHHIGCLNIDHRIVASATITATRPYNRCVPSEVLMYETPSSTEWGFVFEPAFRPDIFYDISGYEVKKTMLMVNTYKEEMRPEPHPRSFSSLTLRSKYWGSVVGVHCAEAFQLVRCLR